MKAEGKKGGKPLTPLHLLVVRESCAPPHSETSQRKVSSPVGQLSSALQAHPWLGPYPHGLASPGQFNECRASTAYNGALRVLATLAVFSRAGWLVVARGTIAETGTAGVLPALTPIILTIAFRALGCHRVFAGGLRPGCARRWDWRETNGGNGERDDGRDGNGAPGTCVSNCLGVAEVGRLTLS